MTKFEVKIIMALFAILLTIQCNELNSIIQLLKHQQIEVNKC